MAVSPAPGALSDNDMAKVAAEAKVDPRTVARALRGLTRSLVTRMAIAKALRVFGFKREAMKLERSNREKKGTVTR